MKPYAASAAWYAAYVRSLLEGSTLPEGGRHPNRCLVSGGEGREPVTLTVPVSGGGSSLKRHGADPALSDHGNWRHLHRQALLTAYGRTPYFPHYSPALFDILEAPHPTLSHLTQAVHSLVVRALNLDEVLRVFKITPRGEALTDACRAMRAKTDPALSVLDLLMRFGPDAVFALLPDAATLPAEG